MNRLHTQWQAIQDTAEKEKRSKGAKPVTLYEEPNLLVKVVRDLFNEDFSKLVVQGEKSWNTVNDYVSELAPEMADRLERHENDEIDVFSVYRGDEQLNKALERTVWLPSGGTLVIDRTEAMTVVDVNTGKFTGSGGDLEETVTRNNLEAAEEIVRQLRLRDIGGIIIVDFIARLSIVSTTSRVSQNFRSNLPIDEFIVVVFMLGRAGVTRLSESVVK